MQTKAQVKVLAFEFPALSAILHRQNNLFNSLLSHTGAQEAGLLQEYPNSAGGCEPDTSPSVGG